MQSKVEPQYDKPQPLPLLKCKKKNLNAQNQSTIRNS